MILLKVCFHENMDKFIPQNQAQRKLLFVEQSLAFLSVCKELFALYDIFLNTRQER